MNVRSAGVSKAGFRSFEVRGDFAKLVDVHTDLCLDELKTLPDGHATAVESAGDG